MPSLREKLSTGLQTFDKGVQDKVKKIKDNVKAGVDVGGAVIKTMGKRMIGDDSPTELNDETKKTLGLKDNK